MTQSSSTEVCTSVTTVRGLRPQVAFWICALLLGGTCASSLYLQKGKYLDKAPVPLHKELARLDKAQLSPYVFSSKQPAALSDEVVEALGTREFIQWRLEDTRRPPSDPLRYALLFVTYYTGGRALVPHTPERCFLGAGFTQLDEWNLRFPLKGVEQTGGSSDVSAKGLVFGMDGASGAQQVVFYTFYANCEYACEANYLRVALNNLSLPKSFFSKVEVCFAGDETNPINPKEATKAAQGLLEVVLPVLMREHWPRPAELKAASAGPAVPSSKKVE